MQAYLNQGPRTVKTPQNEPIPGSSQVANNAGGFGWSVDDLTRLKRFLILGSAGGTYYVGERKLTAQNLEALERLVQAGRGREVVDLIVEISKAGRGVSNDPALFALAACSAVKDDAALRTYALSKLPEVARTGTHVLHFVLLVKQFRGWGRAYKRAVADWFTRKPVRDLAFQAVKYQNRDGYRMRDLLRLAHPHPLGSPDTEGRGILYHWITKGWDAVGDEPHSMEALRLVWAFERAKRATSDREVADLIRKYRMPREAVPTERLHSVEVWNALLEEMPMEAMVRNLATMTREGVLKPMGAATIEVMKRLGDEERIKRARLHPIKLLAATMTYQEGKSVRGDGKWEPLREILDALDMAFYLSFKHVVPTGKRILLAIDTSGSMWGNKVNGIPNLPAAMGAAALALVVAASETTYHIVGFETGCHPLTISPRHRLGEALALMQAQSRPLGTDLAQPILYASERGLDVDAIVMLSDGETWAGRQHPAQALTEYRRKVGHAVKLVNVAMCSTHVTNNDPSDRDALECFGFDTAMPELISAFVRGEF